MPQPKLRIVPSRNRKQTPANAQGKLPSVDLEEIFSVLPEAVLCLDAEWRITWANPLAMQLSRISQEDFGRNHWELYPDTLGTDIERTYRRVMATRITEHFEFFYPPFGIWYDLTLVPMPDGGLVFYYRNATDRRQAEEARDASARQLQEVFAAAPDAILIIDHDWNFTFANQQCLDLLRSGPLVGENLFELFPGNREEPYLSNYTRTMTERVPTEFEAFYPAPLDAWFRVLARPYNNSSIILFFNDITARKQAEIAREQVLDTTDEGVASFDRDFRFTYINRRGREILLGAGADPLGTILWELFPQALGSGFETNYRRTMEERVPTSFEAFYGEPLNLWFNVDARPSRDGIIAFYRDVTARRTAEDTRDSTLARLNQVFEATEDAILSLDRDYNITFLNRRARELLSPAGEILGKNLWETFPETVSESSPYRPIYRSAMDERITGRFEAFYPEPLNLWFQIEATPSGDGITLFFRDITERRRSEEALRTSESRYRVLADLNPQALWSSDPAGEITYANQGFLDYLGHRTQDTLVWSSIFAPQDRERALEAWANSLATREEFDIEARLIGGPERTPRWWRLRALPVRDEAQQVVQWLGVATDVHDASTFAETLLQQQQITERERSELEAVYRTAPIGLALFDPVDFRYLRLNDRQAAFFGLPPEKIVGRTLTEMAPIPGLRELFEDVARGNSVINFPLEGELVTNPGEHRFWTVNYHPVYNVEGHVAAISAASLEITQQKKAEAALIQSEKLAAVGRLATSISHEINNPLEAITNLLYLVALHEELPEELKVYVHLAQSELARVSQIATQTLRFHRQAVRPSHVTAAQLVDAVLNLYQGRLANSGIRVQAVYATSTPVLCFENDIRQVLNNLIANSIDAMRFGGRLVARAHEGIDSPTGRRGIRITIADTGHGMSESTRQRIFEPFYTTKDLNGTGLGLWISAGIVQRHKGRLTVRSSEHPVHHGTAFSLFLPFESPLE